MSRSIPTTGTSALTEEWTYDHLLRQLCDFLCVAIHSICYHRHIYPVDAFSHARIYRIASPRARHPSVGDYINDVVAAVADEMRKNTSRRVQILILPVTDRGPTAAPAVEDEVVYERYIFDFGDFPTVEPTDWHVPIRGTSRDKVHDHQLEHQFRGALLKLASVAGTLGKLPCECTFAVSIDMRDGVGRPEDVDRWVPDPAAAPAPPPLDSKTSADGKPTATATQTGGAQAMLPLRTLDFATLRFPVWMEETRAKLKLPVDASRQRQKQVATSGESHTQDTTADSQQRQQQQRQRHGTGSSLGKRRIEDLSF